MMNEDQAACRQNVTKLSIDNDISEFWIGPIQLLRNLIRVRRNSDLGVKNCNISDQMDRQN